MAFPLNPHLITLRPITSHSLTLTAPKGISWHLPAFIDIFSLSSRGFFFLKRLTVYISLDVFLCDERVGESRERGGLRGREREGGY